MSESNAPDPDLLLDLAEGPADDLAARTERHAGVPEPERAAPGMIEPGADPDVRDDEQQLIADDATTTEVAPEVAAIRRRDESDLLG